MDFEISEIIEHPREAVYRIYRDHLPEVVRYLPNVDGLEILEREETEEGLRLLNRWTVSSAIPRVVRPFFSQGALTYRDHARWADADSLVRWRFEVGLFPDAVDCNGVNYFRDGPTPAATEIVLTGSLQIDLTRVRGVPRILRRFKPKVESFILGLVRPNLIEVAKAVGRFLDEV